MSLVTRGYILELLPSSAMLQLPIPEPIRSRVEQYCNHGVGDLHAATTADSDVGECGTWREWCCVSRRALSELLDPEDGVRTGCVEEQRVFLVPLSEGRAGRLRGEYARMMKQKKKNLG